MSTPLDYGELSKAVSAIRTKRSATGETEGLNFIHISTNALLTERFILRVRVGGRREIRHHPGDVLASHNRSRDRERTHNSMSVYGRASECGGGWCA